MWSSSLCYEIFFVFLILAFIFSFAEIRRGYQIKCDKNLIRVYRFKQKTYEKSVSLNKKVTMKFFLLKSMLQIFFVIWRKNKDEKVNRFALSAIRGEFFERKRERERERERGKTATNNK